MTGACHNLQIITLVIPIDLSVVSLISGKNIVPGAMVEGLESALVASLILLGEVAILFNFERFL